MHCIRLATGLIFLFVLTLLNGPAYSAPACKGPNKYDSGCPDAADAGTEAPAAVPIVVDNATVDWFNQKITIRGTGLSGPLEFILGGSSPLTATPVDDTVVELPFHTTVAGEVDQAGNYVLKVDGTGVLSLFFESQVIDPLDDICPCTTAWSGALGPLWAPPTKTTQCLEISGTSGNDVADIAGTILTNPNDPAVYPHYPIGAAFYPGEPVSSVCRLVEVNNDGSQSDLVNLRINELQQADCAAVLQTNVCAAP
jgi:hypothetical protein